MAGAFEIEGLTTPVTVFVVGWLWNSLFNVPHAGTNRATEHDRDATARSGLRSIFIPDSLHLADWESTFFGGVALLPRWFFLGDEIYKAAANFPHRLHSHKSSAVGSNLSHDASDRVA